jgi:hypothetical protein
LIRKIVFHPLTGLGVALVAAVLVALLLGVRLQGPARWFAIFYVVPVGVPFVMYGFDRAARWREIRPIQWAIDLLVLLLSLSRAFTTAIPLISGHALFLTYALLTSRSWVMRVVTILVLLQVAYLKLFVVRDLTLFGGLVVGLVAGVGFLRAQEWLQGNG